MNDAPIGVPVDGSRDGVGAPSRVDVPVADKLRNLADWLDAHPSAVIDDIDFIDSRFSAGPVKISWFGFDSAETLAAAARAIGGRWEKKAGEYLFTLEQEVIPGFVFKLGGNRDRVCTKVVTGQRTVEVPDPDAPLVTVTEDIVEWRCLPLLARDAAA